MSTSSRQSEKVEPPGSFSGPPARVGTAGADVADEARPLPPQPIADRGVGRLADAQHHGLPGRAVHHGGAPPVGRFRLLVQSDDGPRAEPIIVGDGRAPLGRQVDPEAGPGPKLQDLQGPAVVLVTLRSTATSGSAAISEIWASKRSPARSSAAAWSAVPGRACLAPRPCGIRRPQRDDLRGLRSRAAARKHKLHSGLGDHRLVAGIERPDATLGVDHQPPRRGRGRRRAARGIETQVLALVRDQADLLHAAVAAVVPEQPLLAVEDGKRLVAGVVVPLASPGRMIGLAGWRCQSVMPSLRAGDADLGVVHVAEADVEHHVPVAALARPGRPSPCASPRRLRIGREDRDWPACLVQGCRRDWWRSRWRRARTARRRSTTCGRAPSVSSQITCGHITATFSQGFSATAPACRSSASRFCRRCWWHSRSRNGPGPGRVPHVIACRRCLRTPGRLMSSSQPVGLVRAEHDHRLAPVDAVAAFHQGDARLGPPGEPHPVDAAFLAAPRRRSRCPACRRGPGCPGYFTQPPLVSAPVTAGPGKNIRRQKNRNDQTGRHGSLLEELRMRISPLGSGRPCRPMLTQRSATFQ